MEQDAGKANNESMLPIDAWLRSKAMAKTRADRAVSQIGWEAKARAKFRKSMLPVGPALLACIASGGRLRRTCIALC